MPEQGICTLLTKGGFPVSSAGKRIHLQCRRSQFNSWVRKIHWGRDDRLPYPLQYSWASLVAQQVKNPPAMWGDLGLIPGLGRSPGEGKGYPFQYSGLERVAKSWTRLSDFHFTSAKEGVAAEGF